MHMEDAGVSVMGTNGMEMDMDAKAMVTCMKANMETTAMDTCMEAMVMKGMVYKDCQWNKSMTHGAIDNRNVIGFNHHRHGTLTFASRTDQFSKLIRASPKHDSRKHEKNKIENMMWCTKQIYDK